MPDTEAALSIEVPVLIVGAGPVGLAAAFELQARGIRVLVAERNPDTTRHPKMDVTNGRSMEHFRRWGLADRIRDAAVPRENPMDVVWVTRFSEWEVARFPYPDVHSWRDRIRDRNDGSQPLEPNMRLSQVVLEPLLRDAVEASPLTDLRYDLTFERFEQDSDGVTSLLRDNRTGARVTVRSLLLAGCDGGTGPVRQQLGAAYEGDWNIVQYYMMHFRTPARDIMRRHGIAWHYQSPVGGTMIAQNDEDIFTLHNLVPEGVDPETIDPTAFLHESLGVEFPCEMLQANPWWGHFVVSDGYGQGRVWLAGDSTHQFVPCGGYGMNTGIGDAVDLGWKFAAVLGGWGGPSLLKSIEAERRPVALANKYAATRHMGIRIRISEAYDPLIHENTPEGAAARASLGRLIEELGNAENSAQGVELGSRYRASPIICGEPDEPRWDFLEYVPSSWPGVRAPHVFLEDGSPIFDRLGPWFTLLRFAPVDAGPLVSAAEARGVPLAVVDIDDANAARIYERSLVLVRPDQHVAWRGNAPPKDALAVIDRIRGA